MRAVLLLVLLADVSPRPDWTDSFASRVEGRWKVVSGEWKFEEGVLTGVAGADDCAVIRLVRPPRGMSRLDVDVTLVGNAGEGAHLDFCGQSWFHYRGGWTGIYPPYADSHQLFLAPDRTVHLTLRRLKTRYLLSIDGKIAIDKEGMPPEEFPTDLVQLYAVRGATVRYDNLRIR